MKSEHRWLHRMCFDVAHLHPQVRKSCQKCASALGRHLAVAVNISRLLAGHFPLNSKGGHHCKPLRLWRYIIGPTSIGWMTCTTSASEKHQDNGSQYMSVRIGQKYTKVTTVYKAQLLPPSRAEPLVPSRGTGTMTTFKQICPQTLCLSACGKGKLVEGCCVLSVLLTSGQSHKECLMARLAAARAATILCKRWSCEAPLPFIPMSLAIGPALQVKLLQFSGPSWKAG